MNTSDEAERGDEPITKLRTRQISMFVLWIRQQVTKIKI